MFCRAMCIAISLCFSASILGAQTVSTDSLLKRINRIEALQDALAISGYIQFNAQWAAAPGALSFAGGNFPADEQTRFQIRRGRFKAVWKKNYVKKGAIELVFQPDFNERSITVRDFYGTISEPWTGKFSLTVGQFNRPFSFELLYGSALRETPERARFEQILLVDERDLGTMLTFKEKNFKAQLAAVNGNAMSAENDSKKDLIGRVSWSKSFGKTALSLGASAYSGGVRQATTKAYAFENGAYALKDTLTTKGAFAKRQYLGADAQLSIQNGFGKTTLRAEAVVGTQPGTFASPISPRTAAGLTGDLYERPVLAECFYLIQKLGKSPFEAVVKFDSFDGNARAAGRDLNPTEHMGAADLKYLTLGLGLNFYWKNLTWMLYYDHVRNEKAALLAGFENDLKDDVFTSRWQIKF